MKKLTLTAAVLIAIAAQGAIAATASSTASAKKPVTKWMCEDFLAIDESYQPKAVYFAEGFNKKNKPVDSVMDVDGIEKIVPMVIQECKKDPKSSFWSKVKSSWAKVKADM